MCNAAHGPEHDDPAAAEVCDLYHRFHRSDLPRLERSLDPREKELLWQVALGVGPEGLARRLDTTAEAARGELRALAARLAQLASA